MTTDAPAAPAPTTTYRVAARSLMTHRTSVRRVKAASPQAAAAIVRADRGPTVLIEGVYEAKGYLTRNLLEG